MFKTQMGGIFSPLSMLLPKFGKSSKMSDSTKLNI